MSDLHLGQTMTEAFTFTSAGNAHTFQFDFPPDKIVFNNLTAWTGTAGKLPVSVWFKGQTTAAHAFQQQVIDSSAGASFNFLDTSSNGFTVADLPAGVPAFRAAISAISKANPCVVTVSPAPTNAFQSKQFARITDLGDSMPTARGMSQLDGNLYEIKVLTSTTFALYDYITGEPIDSSSFETYVTGGSIMIENRVISLNNPQVYPYNITPYVPNPFVYNPVTYQLTAGTSVMGTNADVFLIEVYKWGQVTHLGQLL